MKKVKQSTVLLTREQTALFLSISFPTLRKWTIDGLLKCYQLGGRVYYKQSEIFKALKRID